MEVFRISRDKYITDLTGQGAKMHGGRWNKPGTPALYTSEARSLALLEMIVHFNGAAAFNMSYSFACLKIDKKSIIDVDRRLLPADLGGLNNHALWDITEAYFSDKEILGIRVPSIIIPKEYNIVLNPLSIRYKDMYVLNTEPAVIDARLIKNH